MMLNMYKIDHIERNVQDVMNCYTPQVPQHRYSINFMPVVNANNSNSDIRKTVVFDPRSGEANDELVQREKAHSLR